MPLNGIFVFGSNTQGRHGKGNALTARKYFGAIYGQSKGIQGKSYGIVTKDLTKRSHPSISKSYIISQIADLYEYARINPDLYFFIAYSTDGPLLSGYPIEEMASMFSSQDIPENIVFEIGFSELVKQMRVN